LKARLLFVLLVLAGIGIFLALPKGDNPARQPSPDQRSPAAIDQRPATVNDHQASSPVLAQEIKEPGRARPAEISVFGVAVLPGSQERLSDFNNQESPPSHDLELLEETFATYRQIFGQNPPGGTNLEITAALTGKNEKELAIIPPDFAAINSDGEIIDRWGTPYFFHPVSRQLIEVLSAGPDGLLWTGDDVGSITPVGQEAELE
jgi:hypothetical protein